MLVMGIIWQIQYPTVIWRCLMFRDIENKWDIVASLGLWLYMVGAMTTLTYLVTRYV